jgi:hypothetical protein
MTTENTTSSMFESIKNALSSKNRSDFRNIMKTEIDKTYVVRFVPNTSLNPIQTFYPYNHHTWTSVSTNQTVGAMCLTTIGERCPICEKMFKLRNSKDKNEVELSRNLWRKSNWLVNAYVITDPTKPENQGTVKIFRFGKQIKSIIDQAYEGVDATEVGAESMFDLTEKGCSFRIVVKRNEGDYPTYTFSKFLNKSAIEGMAVEKIKDIQSKQTFDLTKVFTFANKKDLITLVEDHLICKEDPFNTTDSDVTAKDTPAIKPSEEDTDDLNMGDDKPVSTTKPIKEDVKKDSFDNIDDLIKDL